MKTFKLFSMAALALVMAACSSEDNALENATPAMPGLIPFSATVAPLSGATTRTVYTPGTNGESKPIINVAWKEGDQIFITRLSPDFGTAGTVTVGKPNDDGSAPLSGNISGANDSEIKAQYPASATSDWGTFTEKYKAQDGTLSGIQDNLDYREGTGKISVIGGNATLADKLQMKSQIAIWKLTLQNTSGANLNATKVTIKDGSDIKAATKDISATSEVYMAVPFNTSPTTFSDLTIEATTADGTYTYAAPSAVNLSHSTYYQSTVKLAKPTDLSTISSNYEVKNGEVLTGTLGSNVKISIADGATVTLKNVNINGTNDSNYEWAGITCLGDATIILSGTNTVKGFYGDYPGIQAAAGKTLIINGTGSLAASSYGWGAGIGGGSGSGAACGNIEIQGGTITATSGEYGAGIGGGNNSSWGNITISGGTVTATGGWRGAGIGGGRKGLSDVSCGNILISGGTVTATGGEDAAGIGGGKGYNVSYKSSCGTITITSGVTKVTATKGEYADNSIGAGNVGTCGTVTFGTQQMYNGTAWSPSPMVAGSYGGLNLAITTTTNTDDTWTLTPVTP